MLALLAGGDAAWATPMPAESARMARAKDLISDDQWAAAIPVLRAAAADPKEPNKDEALFWLAHSQNQAGDLAEAVESIRALQRGYPKSRWSSPAGSLMIELAQKLGRRDVLWRTAVPPPPPAPPEPPPAPACGESTRASASSGSADARCRRHLRLRPRWPLRPRPRRRNSRRRPPPPRDVVRRVLRAGRGPPRAGARPADSDRRPEGDSDPAQHRARKRPISERRAARCSCSRSRAIRRRNRIVVDVAKSGAESVRLAAIRELGRFGGPDVAHALLEVYSTANAPVKLQVVVSLGERADAASLFRIAQAENDDRVRDAAILTLGRAGGREQQRVLFSRASRDTRRAIVRSLFLARDDDSLIALAGQEKDPAVRAEMLSRLRTDRHAEGEGVLESVHEPYATAQLAGIIDVDGAARQSAPRQPAHRTDAGRDDARHLRRLGRPDQAQAAAGGLQPVARPAAAGRGSPSSASRRTRDDRRAVPRSSSRTACASSRRWTAAATRWRASLAGADVLRRRRDGRSRRSTSGSTRASTRDRGAEGVLYYLAIPPGVYGTVVEAPRRGRAGRHAGDAAGAA